MDALPTVLAHRGFGPNLHKVVVSLCDYSGNWPRPYSEAGYTVLLYDIKHGSDVTKLCPERVYEDAMQTINGALSGRMPLIVGVMASPPCTDFTISGAQYWKAKDADGRTAASLSILDACVRLAAKLKPAWWVLENPVGRLGSLRVMIGQPTYFQPHHYAGYCPTPGEQLDNQYTKKTGLWGNFTMPARRDKRPLTTGNDSWVMKLGGKSERTKELRSMTPMGFARAFHRANP